MPISFDDMIELAENHKINEIVQIYRHSRNENLHDSIEKLLSVMQTTDNINLRNTLAVVLMELQCSRAVPVIVDLIIHSEKSEFSGVLFYVLHNMDCTDEIKNIIDPIYYQDIQPQYFHYVYKLVALNVPVMMDKDKQVCIDIIKNQKHFYQTNNNKDLFELLNDIEKILSE